MSLNALLCNPELVILDEPTNGLDPQGMKEIRDLISFLASEKRITFFISTHLLNEVEMICNSVAILNQGKIVTQGSVEELLNTEYELIEIVTTSIDEASKFLANLECVKDITESIESLKIKIEKGYSNEINKLLVSNDVDVKYIIPQNESLEDYFIKMISGGEKDI